MRKLHIVNMPFCSALFLKTVIKAAEVFEHLIILSRGLAPSGPLSFCQSFPCVFLQAAEISVFSKVRVCEAQRKRELAAWQAEQAHHTTSKEKQEVPDGELPVLLIVCGFLQGASGWTHPVFIFSELCTHTGAAQQPDRKSVV